MDSAPEMDLSIGFSVAVMFARAWPAIVGFPVVLIDGAV
jgi:hypothetical protein